MSIKSFDSLQNFTHTNDRLDGIENLNQTKHTLLGLTDEHDLLRSVRLRDDTLYVELPQQLNDESKEKFVNLLEFAEDTLHCKQVIVFFNKARSDRASLVKTFMFLGFHLLSPNNSLMNNNDKQEDQLYLVYQIDD